MAITDVLIRGPVFRLTTVWLSATILCGLVLADGRDACYYDVNKSPQNFSGVFTL
jgi:hypothetical protein